MQLWRYLYVGVLGVCLQGCSGNSETPATETASKSDTDTIQKTPSEQPANTDCLVLKANARKMDSTLLKQMDLNKDLGNKAIKAFLDFAHYCKQDSAAPVFLIKTAQVAQALTNYEQAKIALETCITDYPEFKNKAAALFLLGQLYDEAHQLNDEVKALQYYKQIIKEYPKTDWAASAQGAIALLGKTDAEILHQFEKKNK